MGPINVEQLLEGKNDQPNEVCLTLYFKEKRTDLHEQIKSLLMPEVGLWVQRPAFRLPVADDNAPFQQEAYRASEPPEQFQSIFLFFIRPDLTKETLAVQLIVSILGHPKEGWQLAANWLHHARLRLHEELKSFFLGYSVTYQAKIAYIKDTFPSVSQDLLSSLWWIHQHKQNPITGVITMQQVSAAGWLWLISYPTTSEEGIIYLVLGRDNRSQHLASEAYATRNSQLCSIDAFTHKALKQGIELNERYAAYEKSTVKPLQDAIHRLLQKTIGQDELNSMAHQIKPYVDFCWAVERLAYSIKQQISGINRSYLFEPMPPIAYHHLLRIKVYEEDAQAIVDKNKSTLEIARTALSMAEAVETKQGNDKQERFNLLITFVATFLTVYQILDSDFIKEFLPFFKFKMPVVTMSKPTHIGEEQVIIPYWYIFWSRVVSALILTGIIFCISWLIREYWKKFTIQLEILFGI